MPSAHTHLSCPSAHSRARAPFTPASHITCEFRCEDETLSAFSPYTTSLNHPPLWIYKVHLVIHPQPHFPNITDFTTDGDYCLNQTKNKHRTRECVASEAWSCRNLSIAVENFNSKHGKSKLRTKHTRPKIRPRRCQTRCEHRCELTKPDVTTSQIRWIPISLHLE